MTAVIVASQSRRNTTQDSAETGQKSTYSPQSVAAPKDEATIISQKRLPIVPMGLSPDSSNSHPKIFGVSTGVDRPPNYYIKKNQLFQAGSQTEIRIANKEAAHLSGLAYDGKRERLVVSSFGGEGYLDFFDLQKQEWTKSVSLQGKDVQSITFWNDQLCGIEMDHDEDTVNTLLFFDSDGNFLRSLNLSFPVIAPNPRLGDWLGKVTLYVGARDNIYYRIDPESGEVTGNFRQGYQGTPATLVAVYEASDDHDSLGTLEVTIDPKSPDVLVLSAYEGVHWKVWGGDHLRKVIVNGYDKPEISGLPEDCEVSVMSHETSGEYLPFAHELQSLEMCLLLSKLEEQGIGVKSIAAGYQATTAIVR